MRTTRATPVRLLLAGVSLVLAAVGWGIALADTPPPPGLGVRLLDAPSNRSDDPRARVYVVDQVRPGAVFTRHVEVANGEVTAMDVLVYPAAATIGSGGFEIAGRGAPGEVPRWTTVAPSALHLEPGQRSSVTVTVRVPANAPTGEVYGAVVAERPAGRTDKGVALAIRAGIRVYLSVGPGGEPASDFTVDALTAGRDSKGVPYVLAQVHNTGGRALDMSGHLRLEDGPGGLSAGPFNARLGTTLGIGQSGPVLVPLDKAIPAGPWLASLELKSGDLRRKVEGTVTFPVRSASQSPPVVPEEVPFPDEHSVVVPVAIGLVAVMSLLLLAFALLVLWKRRREPEEEEDQ
ncbi:MAG TPA: peptidase [Mycobacteriales bacterium]|nr:peptidase [Mycobacteriales bacterium]